jgi:hypothetical protein
VHRIGRTGRCGKTGVATTFINKEVEESALLDLKHLLIEAKQRVPPVRILLCCAVDTSCGTHQPACGMRKSVLGVVACFVLLRDGSVLLKCVKTALCSCVRARASEFGFHSVLVLTTSWCM